MNLYTNHFNCTRNNDTGETVIQFLQVSPHLVSKSGKYELDGIQTDLVASVVMTSENAKELIKALKEILGE